MGMYNMTDGLPSTVLFDAGTVSCTAASTEYEITISQTISAGWYCFAANTQTAAATNTFVGPNGDVPLGILNFLSASFFPQGLASFREAGITGAFATAVTVTRARDNSNPGLGIRIV
jgi:hypothetical protein